MKQKHISRIIALGVFLLIVGYIGVLDALADSDRTFTLIINGVETVVKLPNGFPNTDKVTNRADMCWDTKLCAATFCLGDEATHGHVRFFYSGKHVVALGWKNKEQKTRHWLYTKGVSMEVSYKEFVEALDSIWRKPKDKQEGTI